MLLKVRSESLQLLDTLDAEIAHFYEPATNTSILSTANKFVAKLNGTTHRFEIPVGIKSHLFGHSRLLRRALRLDKSNALFNFAQDGIVVLYAGSIYFYDLTTRSLSRTGRLRQCRNVLHGGIARSRHGLFFGEYGANSGRTSVPVWGSYDDGRSWHIVHEFPAGSIKHVHGVYVDPYSDSLWIPTGDLSGECYVFEVKGGDFGKIVRHGDGQQQWRPVSMFFEPDRIVWAMDSQLETSFLQTFDRATCTLTQGRSFSGPVWYSKRFSDGLAILQTTVEIGDGVHSDYCHILVSEDLDEWREVAKFRKDRYPMRYFKFGVVAFAEGSQPSTDFLLFGEALRGFDGKVHRAAVVPQ